jgi:hypothetical protein
MTQKESLLPASAPLDLHRAVRTIAVEGRLTYTTPTRRRPSVTTIVLRVRCFDATRYRSWMA